METIPARRGKATYLKRGQSIRIVNTHGSQVVDTWAFTAGMLTEFMSMEHTRATLTRMIPRPGDGLYTNRRRKILTMTGDTSRGDHDTKLPKGPYGEAELTEQLRALMLREGIAKAHIAGISMGGSLAQHFGGTYPEMVDRLILCDCTPRYNDGMRANWPVRAELARKNGSSVVSGSASTRAATRRSRSRGM